VAKSSTRLEYTLTCVRFRVQGSGFRVQGSGFRSSSRLEFSLTCVGCRNFPDSVLHDIPYGVATFSRLLQIIGLFGKKAL